MSDHRWSSNIAVTLLLSATLLCAAPTHDGEPYRRTQLAGMGVLTGWAVANIAGGIAGALTVKSDRRFIHEMNAMWNSVNLTLGIIGLVTNARRPTTDPQRLYRKARRVYMINGALDLLYITAGVITSELGRAYHVPRLRGYGKSIAFQGAFLFVFDLGMLIAHERAARARRSRADRSPLQ